MLVSQATAETKLPVIKSWKLKNPDRVRQINRDWAANNPEKVKAHRLKISKEQKRKHKIKTQYGLLWEDFLSLYVAQNQSCAICKTPLALFGPINTNVACVDHCHKSNKVRGLLCKKCNLGIGYLNDSVDNCKSAIKYLKAHQ